MSEPSPYFIDTAADISCRELALRQLPLPYSLALRLRDAKVAAELICEYIGVDRSALVGVFRVGEAKLAAAQESVERHRPRLSA
jgi:hypothetical protein